MPTYRLRKDFPDAKAGAIFNPDDVKLWYFAEQGNLENSYHFSLATRDEWLEEIRMVCTTCGQNLPSIESDTRTKQARRLYDLGYAKELGIDNFEKYLESIPDVPAGLVEEDKTFPLLTLDDPRVPRTVRARLVGVKHEEFGCGDGSFVPCDARHETGSVPYWFRAHDGRVNRGKKPSVCREEATKRGLFAGTAEVGLAIWIHHQNQNVAVEGKHVMDLPGSVHRDYRACCAYLWVWGGSPKLGDCGHGVACPQFGSVVFRRE